MISENDKIWLSEKYPKLVTNDKGIDGIIEFSATYNFETNRFLILEKDTVNEVGGVMLSGIFTIHIQERVQKIFSNLPALYIENIDTSMDRHFNQTDKTGCLCSPLEEEEFLFPSFHFKLFFEQLVIPFLYGQLFYSINKHWPWSEYGHGSTGLFESYFRIADPNKAGECIEKLSKNIDWKKIKSLLIQKTDVKGHTPCFCAAKDHIRRCHPYAWKGIQQLKYDIKSLGIKIHELP